MILDTQPKGGSAGGGETREAVVARLAGELLGKMPELFDPGEKGGGRGVRCGPARAAGTHARVHA